MPDDDRTRRRLGDATKSRIADLASGWSVDAPPSERPPTAPDVRDDPTEPTGANDPTRTPPAESTSGPVRAKRKTNPPPPPGSPERKALEEKIIATTSRDDDVTDVVPQDRRKQATGSQAAIAAPADPRSTQPQGSRQRVPTGQHVIARERVPTGPQPAAAPSAADPRSTQPHAGVPGRAKEPTRPPPPPGSPERAKAATGSQPVVTDRTRTSTGAQPLVGDRTKPATTPPPPPPARVRGGTGQQPAIGERARGGTGQQPVIGERPRGGTGQQPVIGERPRGGTGQQPVIGERPKPPTAPPAPPARAGGGTGPQPVIGARGKVPSVPPPVARAQAASTPPPERSKVPSVPPPMPPIPSALRAKLPSSPPFGAAGADAAANPFDSEAPSGPKFPRATYDGPPPPLATSTPAAQPGDARPFATEQRTPAVIVDTAAFAGNTPPPAAGELPSRAPARDPVVPTGEFDTGAETVRQITAKRDAAEAILKIPDDETPVEDLVDDDDDDDPDDKRPGDPATEKFERGDPTQNGSPDATEIQSPRVKQMTGGTLRRSAALRRKRGLYGDVRYVFTALFGVRRSKNELAELDHRQALRETSRRRHLITLGRAAATMDNFDHPALGKARDLLAAIEDERAKHAGAVAASDAELDRVRRERENNVKQHAEATAKADAELAELAKKLEPLEKESTTARKKAAELRDEVHRIDKKISDTEALLVSVKGEKMDKAGIQADIATFKANKQAVLRDEPTIAAELDALNPRIAALEATRAELNKKKLELDKSDQDDQRRTLELLDAIGAKRKVVERASADAEAARDNALFDLGDRLYVDRPQQLTPELSPIDRIDLEIGEDERRSMELKEILSNIDKMKFARGLAMIIVALAGVVLLVWAFLSLTS